eukprot:14326611-Alexandrium_andersonii.AAC.1
MDVATVQRMTPVLAMAMPTETMARGQWRRRVGSGAVAEVAQRVWEGQGWELRRWWQGVYSEGGGGRVLSLIHI